MSLRRIQKGSPEEILIDREKEPPSVKGGSLLSVVQHLLNCCADNRFITVVQSHILTQMNIVVVKHFCNTLFENSPGISSFKWCFPIIVGMRTDMIVPYVHISV